MPTFDEITPILKLMYAKMPIKEQKGDEVNLRYLQDVCHTLLNDDHSRSTQSFLTDVMDALVFYKELTIEEHEHLWEIAFKVKQWNRPGADFAGWFGYSFYVWKPDSDHFEAMVPEEVR